MAKIVAISGTDPALGGEVSRVESTVVGLVVLSIVLAPLALAFWGGYALGKRKSRA